MNTLRTRIGHHRTSSYALLIGKPVDLTDDEHSLGVHLYTEHGLRHRSDFNKHYKICIIDNASPKMLELKEHKYIHLLKTLQPLWINTVNNNPFGLNLLH